MPLRHTLALVCSILGLSALGALQTANATVILEGSDAIGFHCGGGSAGTACAYRDQVWTALAGSDARPIAVITDFTYTAASGTHPVLGFTSIAAAGDLNGYSAVYIEANGTCCSSDIGMLTAAGVAALAAYEAGGGTIMIGDYDGNAAWDFLVGGGGTAASHVSGIGGALPGPGCDDTEKVTADGILNGFTQPSPIGCWTHQSYQQSFFGALGFTRSFFDSPAAVLALNPGLGPFSSLLSRGVTKSCTPGTPGCGETPVPEPLTLGLLGMGVLGLGLARRRRQV